MRKNNIKQLLKQSIDEDSTGISDSADYDVLFQKYEKNLYKTHSVPKIKMQQSKYW